MPPARSTFQTAGPVLIEHCRQWHRSEGLARGREGEGGGEAQANGSSGAAMVHAPRKSGSWGRPTAPARAGGRHRSYRRRTRATRWRRRSGRARPAPRAPRSRPRPRQLGEHKPAHRHRRPAGLDPDGGDDTIILGNEGGIAQRIAGKTDRPLGPHQAAPRLIGSGFCRSKAAAAVKPLSRKVARRACSASSWERTLRAARSSASAWSS